MTLAHAPAKDSRPVAPALPESRAQVFSFDNGLTLIVEEDHSAPVASVQAWCATGSIDEGKWMGAGLSHILEHMLFKGTQDRKAGDIARQIQDRGGYINAYTSFDRTVFWIDVPAEGVSEAVAILSDAMMNSTLPEDEYVKEQEVIRREFAMGFDDPGRQSSQLMLRTVFSESPFRHPVIGYLDVYNKLKRDDVMGYYKTRYAPNNLTFVVAGDVDAQKVREQVEELVQELLPAGPRAGLCCKRTGADRPPGSPRGVPHRVDAPFTRLANSRTYSSGYAGAGASWRCAGLRPKLNSESRASRETAYRPLR